jgi:hypothetical protein
MPSKSKRPAVATAVPAPIPPASSRLNGKRCSWAPGFSSCIAGEAAAFPPPGDSAYAAVPLKATTHSTSERERQNDTENRRNTRRAYCGSDLQRNWQLRDANSELSVDRDQLPAGHRLAFDKQFDRFLDLLVEREYLVLFERHKFADGERQVPNACLQRGFHVMQRVEVIDDGGAGSGGRLGHIVKLDQLDLAAHCRCFEWCVHKKSVFKKK